MALDAPRLNLGCGTDIRPGHVNLDSAALPGVDVVHDLSELPLPFEDGRFEHVVCKDILEHVDFVAVLRELHRVTRPGARLEITSPHYTSRSAYVDPTHKTSFSIDTLRFFIKGGVFGARDYYFDFHFSGVERARIVFHRYRWLPWNYLIEPLVNATPGLQRWYEESPLSGIFPASNIEVTLVR